MPWTIKEEGNKFCIYKESTDEKVACHPTMQAAENQRKALYAQEEKQLESLTKLTLEDGGPVVLGVAVTNNPALPLPPIEIVSKEGEKFFRVPFLRRGIFTDPRYGKMVFDKEVFAKVLENHDKGASHFGVSLNLRHKPELGALAWFTKDKGGFLAEENDPDYGNLLVAYGKPTTETALELIEKDVYRYASVEYMPKYKSNMVKQLSADDLVEIRLEDLVDLEEVTMSDVTISQAEYDELKTKAEKYSEIESLTQEKSTLEEQLAQSQASVAEAKEQITELETQITQLKTEKDEEDDEVIPESVKIALEELRADNRRLKQSGLNMFVENVITKAQTYRDESGRGHSPILLEIAQKAMLGQPIEEEGVVIKLEGSSLSDMAEYNRKAWMHLLNTIPGQVLLESANDENEDLDNPYNTKGNFTKEDFSGLWS